MENKKLRLRDLMTEREIETYNHSKKLNELFEVKEKQLKDIGIQLKEHKRSSDKKVMNYYKALINHLELAIELNNKM